MDPITQAAAVPMKSGIGWLRGISLSFLFLFLILIVINVIYISLQQHSIVPALKEIGGQFLMSTQKLSDTSNQIIAKGGLYQATDDFWGGIINLLSILGALFIAVYLIYTWLLILYKVVPFTGLCNKGENLKNIFIALLIFFLLQSAILTINAAVADKINSFNDGVEYLIKPLTAFWDFAKAIPYILSPATKMVEKVCSAEGGFC